MRKLTGATSRRVLGAPWGRRRRKECSMLHDDLARWISDLRDRLSRETLMELPPFDLGHGTRRLPGETTVRVMLADFDDLDDPAGSASHDPAWHRQRLC